MMKSQASLTGKLSKKDTEHVAKLAKLELTSKETDKFSEQLSEILLYVDELSEVNTNSVESMSQNGLENVAREDEIDETKCLDLEGFVEIKQILNKDA